MAESITNSVMARRIKKGPEDCPMALGKGAFGGITEGCSPGGQTWKLCGREVKTGTDKFPRRLAGKERREREQKLEREAGMEVGFSRQGELFILIGWEIQGRERKMDGARSWRREGGRDPTLRWKD